MKGSVLCVRYKVLAIFDTEKTYADLLTKQLLRIKNHGLQIHNFSSKDQLLKFAGQEVIHYLVISDEYEKLEREVGSLAEVVYWLTTDRNKLWVAGNKHYIYRYQSAQDIHSLICKVEQTEIKEDCCDTPVKMSKVLGIYSPVHRNGQTVFAKALASSYAGEFTKALYVNFEEYSGVEMNEDEADLADLLYYLRQDLSRIELQEKLKALTKESEDYDYIVPMSVSQELKNVEGEEWKNLIDMLKSISTYEAIILDLDSCIQGFYDVLRVCDYIYSPVRKSNNDDRKQRQFNRNLQLLYPKEFQHKIVVLDIPECEVVEGEDVLDYMKRYALCLAKDGCYD